MSKVYTTQDYLKIELTYQEDVASNIASAVIKYIDPEGATGTWTAVHTPSTKTISYNLPVGNPLDVAGKWTVWSYATMTDGRKLPGETFKFRIDEEGT